MDCKKSANEILITYLFNDNSSFMQKINKIIRVMKFIVMNKSQEHIISCQIYGILKKIKQN